MRAFLQELGLNPFLKTSGGKGLHVVVPLKPGSCTWDELREFSEAVSVLMFRQYPNDYVTTMSKAKRKGKVFIDYLRNVREASAIAPYSTRSREGAPVSVPIAWTELTARLDPRKFTIETVPGRLKKLKADPWADFDKSRRPLNLKKLAAALTEQS
jgi:bifunctional non-homologous end joining protein LigD